MGKVEKAIVLGVLFVIAVILVVSLTVDDPLDKQKVVIPGAPPPRAPAAQDQPAAAPLVAQATPPAAAPATAAQPKGAAPAALLSAQITNPVSEPAAAAPVPAPVVIPAGSLLKSSAGLEEGFSPEFKFYVWQAGDNFRSIATRFYGDATKVALLRRFNEGRYDVTPGERIYIPVFDADGPRTPVAVTGDAPSAALPSAAALNQPAPSTAAVAGGARVHVVLEGESLWKISKQELGVGSRWKEIYEANRDVMSSPEALHTGLKLRIP